MATYAIGDVQGCFAEMQTLLQQISFNPQNDSLWFTGDLVNRGPQSLEVLRFIKKLNEQCYKLVLGNHDLHLLAVHYGVRKMLPNDTLAYILKAPDRDELMDWLRKKPLFYHDKDLQFVLTHAGMAPSWDLTKARQLAEEVEMVLHSENFMPLLTQMFANSPDQWNDQLTGFERLRCIINYFTRMRFCYADGRLDLTYKGEIAGKPDALIPWFDVPNRVNRNVKIIFGHWAALGGKTNVSNIYPLDTGCVWGNCLTAMRLEDEKYFSVKC